MQKHVNLVDLVKSFPTNIYLQKLASIQPRTSHLIFIILAAPRDLIFAERSSPFSSGHRRADLGSVARGSPGRPPRFPRRPAPRVRAGGAARRHRARAYCDRSLAEWALRPEDRGRRGFVSVAVWIFFSRYLFGGAAEV